MRGCWFELSRGAVALAITGCLGSVTSPQITAQPTAQRVGPKARLTFTVTATGAGPLTYQWEVKPPGASAFSPLAGADAATLVIPAASRSLHGSDYRVVVSNASGVATSTAAGLSVRSGALSMKHVVVDPAFHDGYGKSIGDLNGDGKLDLVVGSGSTDGLVWYENPTWQQHVIAPGTYAGISTDIEVADLNGDGHADVVAATDTPGKYLVWFEGPSCTPHVIDATREMHDIEVADLDGDGQLDLVGRFQSEFDNLAGNAIHLYQRTSADSWRHGSLAIPHGEGLKVRDLDGDGKVDLIVNRVWVKNGLAPGADATLPSGWTQYTYSTTWTAQSTFVDTGDFNGDGRLDIVLTPSELVGQRYHISWFEAPQDRASAWSEHIVDPDVESVHHFVAAADMNLDGTVDVVTAEMAQGVSKEVKVYLNKGSGAAWTKRVIATTASHSCRVADLDGDGDIELFGANWGSSVSPSGPSVELWMNQTLELGALFPIDAWHYSTVDNARAKFDSANRFFGLAWADVDHDGLEDVISGRYVYRNPGGAMTGQWTRATLPITVDAMLATDVDGDANPDVIGESLPAVYWLEPNADGSTWSHIQIGTLSPTAHVNGQGYAVAQIVPGGKAEILLSSGDGIFYFEVPSTPASGNWPKVQIAGATSEEAIATGDVDGDGLIDVLSADASDTSIYWWRNPGDGTPGWERSLVGHTTQPADRRVAADLNRDGRLDLVVTEETPLDGASVYWFEQPLDAKQPWVRHLIVTQATTNSLDVADMNGDGLPDVVTGEHRGTKKVAIWENVGAGASFVEHVVSTGKESHLGARVVDLDHDGDLDIISIAWDEYALLHLWRNDAL